MFSFLRAGRHGLRSVSAKASLLTKAAPVTTYVRTSVEAVAAPAPYFELEVVDGVAIVRMDQPNSAMNTISISMQEEFAGVLDEIESNPAIVSAVLISKKPGCFVAGADIQMINNVSSTIDCFLVWTYLQQRIHRGYIYHVSSGHKKIMM